MLSLSFCVYFLSDKLAKHTWKMYLLCFHLLIFSKSICYNHSLKGGLFNSSDLTLVFLLWSNVIVVQSLPMLHSWSKKNQKQI